MFPNHPPKDHQIGGLFQRVRFGRFARRATPFQIDLGGFADFDLILVCVFFRHSVPSIDGCPRGSGEDRCGSAVESAFGRTIGNENNVFRLESKVGRLAGHNFSKIHGNFGALAGCGISADNARLTLGGSSRQALSERHRLQHGNILAVAQNKSARAFAPHLPRRQSPRVSLLRCLPDKRKH